MRTKKPLLKPVRIKGDLRVGNRIAGIAALGCVALLVTGCSGGTPATNPTPTSASAPGSSSSATTLPFAGAPKVANPLPASVLSGDPCTDALTPEQVKTAIGVEVQGKRKDVAALGPYCSWFNPASLGRVAVSFTINTH